MTYVIDKDEHGEIYLLLIRSTEMCWNLRELMFVVRVMKVVDIPLTE